MLTSTRQLQDNNKEDYLPTKKMTFDATGKSEEVENTPWDEEALKPRKRDPVWRTWGPEPKSL